MCLIIVQCLKKEQNDPSSFHRYSFNHRPSSSFHPFFLGAAEGCGGWPGGVLDMTE